MTLPASVINGRFKVLDRPEPAPGHCAVCGSVSKPVVDFDMTVDYYGAILLCVDCVREAFINLGNLYPALMAPAQVGPLSNAAALDVGTVHEYLAASLDATNRLVAILPDADFLDEDAEVISKPDRDNADQSDGANAGGTQLTFFERPDDVSGFTSRNLFDS